MAKRICLIFLTVLLAVYSLTACSESHVHSWTYYISKNATCTEDGVLEMSCSCGVTEFGVIKAKGHNRDSGGVCLNCDDGKVLHTHEFVYQTLQEKTCYQKGVVKGVCICGETVVEDVAMEHDYDEFGSCKYCQTTLNTYTERGIDIEMLDSMFSARGFDIYNSPYAWHKYVVSNVRIGDLGVSLTFEINGKISLGCYLGKIQVDYDVKLPSNVTLDDLSFINKLGFTSYGHLVIAYLDGTVVDFGKTIYTNYTNETPTVKSVVVTNEGILLIIKGENKAVIAGRILQGNIVVNPDELLYRKVGNEYYVVGTSNRTATSINIPLTHKGLPITKIENNAFSYNTYLQEIIIGNNVTEIGEKAFLKCSNLKKVVLGNSVETISRNSFFKCENLTTINFPTSLKNIKAGAFYKTNLKNVIIPNNVNRIEQNAFAEISNPLFTRLTIRPDGWLEGCFNNSSIYYYGEWQMSNEIPVVKS